MAAFDSPSSDERNEYKNVGEMTEGACRARPNSCGGQTRRGRVVLLKEEDEAAGRRVPFLGAFF